MNRKWKILNALSETSYVVASTLAKQLSVSVRTIRNDISDLNRELDMHGAHIESKPRYGFRLQIMDDTAYRNYLHKMNGDEKLRWIQIAEYLLELDTSITMDELCDVFFISRSTLKSDMKSIRQWMNEYNIQLDHRANQGLKIQGKEQDIRRCMIAIQRNFNNDNAQSEIRKIRTLIEQTLESYSLEMSDFAIANLSLHVFILLMRVKTGKVISYTSDMEYAVQTESSQAFIRDIVDQVEKQFMIHIPKQEVDGLFIQILGKQSLQTSNTVVTQEIYQLVKEMLAKINDVFKIDFQYDLELITSLSMHLVPLDIRIRHHLIVQNAMTDAIMQSAILPFNMASIASEILEKKYRTILSKDEISFIALHFCVAIERKRKGQKYKLLVVCGSGKASSELLVYQIKQKLGNLFDVVGASSRHALKNYDFTNVDYILTTVDIDQHVPVPIIMTENFLDLNEVKNIEREISSGHIDRTLHYFKEDFICWIDVNSKDEAIEYLCQKAKMVRRVPDNFYDCVMERERIGHTSFGNSVSIAHPIRPIGNQSFVGLAILKHSVDWDGQDVQIVFLLSMKEQGDRDLQDFYKIMSMLVSHKELSDQLIQSKTYGDVIAILQRAALLTI